MAEVRSMHIMRTKFITLCFEIGRLEGFHKQGVIISQFVPVWRTDAERQKAPPVGWAGALRPAAGRRGSFRTRPFPGPPLPPGEAEKAGVSPGAG